MGVATPDPGFVPIAPSAPAPTPTEIGALAHAPRHLPAAGEPHVVRRGDTLWDIAAARLGPGATPAQIAAAWPRWYAVNRHVIGPDPAVIVPGQRLVPPAAGDKPSAATPARVAQGSTR
jgi:nucleoid-associated protein YgaU